MILVHVGLDLKDKGREIMRLRVNHTFRRHARQRRAGHREEVLKERLYAEVGKRGSEEDG